MNTYDPHNQTVATQTNVAGDSVQAQTNAVAVGGDVAGAEIVAGDQITHIHTYAGSETDLPAGQTLHHWYKFLATTCRRLPLEVIDPKLYEKEGTTGALSLDDVYVDLDVFYRPPGQERDGGEKDDRRAVLELLDQESKVVLLGDAGSGKTTFVNHLAGILAQMAAERAEPPADLPAVLNGPVPVRLVLREAAARHIPPDTPGSAGLLWNAIAQDIATATGCSADIARATLALLQERIAGQGAVFFLDGLDEVSETDGRRKALLEAVRDFAGIHDHCRFMITARPYAYTKPAVRLAGFAEARLAPLSKAQRDRFIERWYEAVSTRTEVSAETAKLKAALLKTAAARPNLAELAERPLLLTLMATLHTSRGTLPEDRAKLYNDSVDLLLGVWQRSKLTTGQDGKTVTE